MESEYIGRLPPCSYETFRRSISGDQVAALFGDGGIQFTIGELGTAVELKLSAPILV